jgi:penicillin-binding protein 2
MFNCPGLMHYKGHDYHCWRQYGHGEINLHQALAGSCDVYFYNVGLRLGDAAMMEWGRRFGFASRLGIDLPGEAAGVMEAEGLPWLLAIGQGKLTITPLQAARMCALVATGGHLAHEVHVVQRVGDVPRAPEPADLHLGAGHLAAVRSGMMGVVNEPGATGYETVHSTVVTIAGKSGSAQMRTGSSETHSWFIGYAPAESPQIAVAVVFEHAGGGAKVAGCTVKRIIETAARQGIIAK